MSDSVELQAVITDSSLTDSGSTSNQRKSNRLPNGSEVEAPTKPVKNAITARALFARVQARFSSESSSGSNKSQGFHVGRGSAGASSAASHKSDDCDSSHADASTAGMGNATGTSTSMGTASNIKISSTGMDSTVESSAARKNITTGSFEVKSNLSETHNVTGRGSIAGMHDNLVRAGSMIGKGENTAEMSSAAKAGANSVTRITAQMGNIAGSNNITETGGLESRNECKLCLEECSSDVMYSLEQCSCAFCSECVREYLRVEISQGNVLSITCPDGECQSHGYIDSDEIQKLVEDRMFEKFKMLKFNKEVDMDPLRTFCPTRGCDAVCYLSQQPPTVGSTPAPSTSASGPRRKTSTGRHSVKESSVSRTSVVYQSLFVPQPVHCTKCGSVFCSLCKYTWHDNKTCDENLRSRLESDGIPFSSTEDSRIKRCPTCNVPIERNDGCAQMMCRQCKHVFCWHCLASLDDDFLLRHYDKGQCKNRLGHSRASVIWHRTQVVGIFAGFGVLLLVASPFLLLAAPCILCCKCKSCHINDDEDADMIPPSTIT